MAVAETRLSPCRVEQVWLAALGVQLPRGCGAGAAARLELIQLLRDGKVTVLRKMRASHKGHPQEKGAPEVFLAGRAVLWLLEGMCRFPYLEGLFKDFSVVTFQT